MQVAFTGVSYWHARLYDRPATRIAGVGIIGVSDDDQALAERVARELGARALVCPQSLPGGGPALGAL
jgi:hypothetical protein